MIAADVENGKKSTYYHKGDAEIIIPGLNFPDSFAPGPEEKCREKRDKNPMGAPFPVNDSRDEADQG